MSVVVGYVPSPEGRVVLERAIAEARARGTRLVALNVPRAAEFAQDFVADADDLQHLDEALAAAGVEHEVRRGAGDETPADTLLDLVEEVGADLVVIGLRRRSPVGKMIMGSTSQRVLLDAPCPVLAVQFD
ncbi:universal stress protein [Pseudokineococcus sp. 5B2Z-1]|uniref:universal stress protein n=1 Tax=Pseudokineococcus sp. 5B2Z-1 TaxID=3132744 RepID=UPI00261EC7BD|nr:universal stress protein [uncultured Pseudokineococcus sp.]